MIGELIEPYSWARCAEQAYAEGNVVYALSCIVEAAKEASAESSSREDHLKTAVKWASEVAEIQPDVASLRLDNIIQLAPPQGVIRQEALRLRKDLDRKPLRGLLTRLLSPFRFNV